MKEYLIKHMETFIYGILSLMFSTAFFFGVLYPSHSISPGAYRTTSPPRSCEHRPVAGQIRETRSERGFFQTAKEYEPEEIECTFFLYECLKNS